MQKFIFVAFSNPAPGREQEFNAWYDQIHLGDIIAVPGIVAAQRFRLADTQVVGDGPAKTPSNEPNAKDSCPWKYLAIYDFETESAMETFKEMFHRMETGVIEVRPVFDFETMTSYLFEPIAPRQTAS